MSRPVRLAVISAAALATLLFVYAVVGFLVVPRVLASQLEQIARDELSLEARTAAIRFDPFRLRLVVEGFTLGEAGGEPSAAFDELRVDLDGPALAGRVVALDELHLGGPRVEIRISPGGGISVAGIPLGADGGETGGEAESRAPDGVPPDEPAPEAAEPGASDADAPPLRQLVIRRLAIEAGRLRLVDESRDPVVERAVGPIDLAVDDLDLGDLLGAESALAVGSPTNLRIQLTDTASLSLRGDLELDPARLDLAVEISRFPLVSLAPWLAPVVRADLRSGELDLQGRLELGLDPQAPDVARFAGSLGVSSLAIGEPGVDEPMLAWKSLDLSEIEVVSAPLALRVGRVSLGEPELRVVLAASGINVAAAFAAPESEEASAAPAAEPEPSAEPATVAIGAIGVEKGRVRFEDRTIQPAYAIALSDLALNVDRFSLDPKGRSAFELASKLDGYAPLSLRGSILPLSPRDFADLTLEIEQLELASFSPYSRRFAAREIDGGRGSLDVHARFEKQQVRGENRVVLERLAFGKRVPSPDATTLPVASAASLLANADGEIVVEVPVAGSFDEPGFSYRGALLDALRALVTHVVRAPFQRVGGMISLGGKLFRPEELEVIAFAGGSSAVEGDEILKLDGLAAAFAQNPELTLEVRGAADPAVDGREDLRALARLRAAVVREYLAARGVDAGRVRIGDVSLSTPVGAPSDEAGSDEAAAGHLVLTQLEVR